MRLENGEAFPAVVGHDADGGQVAVEALTADRWAVVLFYRGHW